jgi:hypothetical protein
LLRRDAGGFVAQVVDVVVANHRMILLVEGIGGEFVVSVRV